MNHDESPWNQQGSEHQPAAAGRWRRSAILLALVALLLGAGGGGAAGAVLTRALMPPAAPVIVAETAPAAPALQPVAAQAATGGTISDIYNQVDPAVVSVGSRGATPGRNGTGSGFIIDKEGYILTNNHVVEGSTRLVAILADGTHLDARVVGTAPGYDLALIKVDPPAGGLTVARLGNSDAVVPGELAVAIGSPLGLERTITSGIVSSTGRTFNGGSRALRDLIQTDAAINPGNSGGPLLNGRGEVIGINTLKAPDTNGIGFAVPINTAKRLLARLRAGERVSVPYLGIQGQTITPRLAQSLNLPVKEGVLVARVVEGGPAASAGLKGAEGAGEAAGGDIITSLDGKPIRRFEDVGAVLDSHRAGDKVTAAILRNGQSQTVEIVLGEWPNQ